MQHLPFYIYLVFGITVIITAWLFFKASLYAKPLLIVTVLWISLQSILGLTGFYSNPVTMTTRFPLLFLPPLLFLIYRFATPKGRLFLDSLDIRTLTILHMIRIPVEMVLFWLFVHQSVPQAMTLEGRNWDILSGITAPLVYYVAFYGNITFRKKIILAWNLLCLVLLINVVSTAILALPGRFQQFSFEQPNIALGYFPFVLLPAFLVPVVLLSNLAGIRWALKEKRSGDSN